MLINLTIPQSLLAYVIAKQHDIPLSQVIAAYKDARAEAEDKIKELMKHLPDRGKKWLWHLY